MDSSDITCQQCGFLFNNHNVTDMIKEIINNSAKTKEVCKTCVTKFVELSQLTDQKKNWDCYICHKTLSMKRGLVRHIISNHVKRQLQQNCNSCGLEYKDCSPETLLQKIIVNSAVLKKPCNECLVKLVNMTEKRRGVYICFVCGKNVARKTRLIAHIVLKHVSMHTFSESNYNENVRSGSTNCDSVNKENANDSNSCGIEKDVQPQVSGVTCKRCRQVYVVRDCKDFLQKITDYFSKFSEKGCNGCISKLAEYSYKNNGNFNCFACKKKISSGKRSLMRHINSHIKRKTIQPKCHSCGAMYKGLAAEFIMKKLVTESASCEEPCDECLHNLVNLTTFKGQYVCFSCGKRVDRKGVLINHIVHDHLLKNREENHSDSEDKFDSDSKCYSVEKEDDLNSYNEETKIRIGDSLENVCSIFDDTDIENGDSSSINDTIVQCNLLMPTFSEAKCTENVEQLSSNSKYYNDKNDEPSSVIDLNSHTEETKIFIDANLENLCSTFEDEDPNSIDDSTVHRHLSMQAFTTGKPKSSESVEQTCSDKCGDSVSNPCIAEPKNFFDGGNVDNLSSSRKDEYRNRISDPNCVLEETGHYDETNNSKDVICITESITCSHVFVQRSGEDLLKTIINNSSETGEICKGCVYKLVERTKGSKRLLSCFVCSRKAFQRTSRLVDHIICKHIKKRVIVQPKNPKCESCGTVYQDCSPEDVLQVINRNSADDKESCKDCVYRLVRMTTVDGLWKCFVCKKVITTAGKLMRHIVCVHTSALPYSCQQCEKKFKFAKYLQLHLKIHGDEKVKCELCGKYLRSDYMKRHIRQEHSDNPDRWICDICGEVKFNRNSYLNHMEKHEGKSLKCSMCDRAFLTKSCVKDHEKKFHLRKNVRPKSEPEKCNLCEKYFAHKKSLKLHVIRRHSSMRKQLEVKRFRCEYCVTAFYTKKELTEHENTHTGSKPYSCEICRKSFMKSSVLSRHKNIHSAEKCFKCASCGLSFNQKCTLTRHQVVHTGEKPFECGICGQRFTQKPYMQKHQEKCGKEKQKVKRQKRRKEESSEESEEEISEAESE